MTVEKHFHVKGKLICFLKKQIGEGQKRKLTPGLERMKFVISILAGLYILLSILMYPHQILYRSVCFGFFFALTFITYTTPGGRNTQKIPFVDWLLVGMSMGVSGYIVVNLNRLLYRYPFVDKVWIMDIVVGVLTVILLIEGTRRIVGLWLPVLCALSIVYVFMGPYIPGRFGHHGFSLTMLIDELFLTTDGIWGSTLGVATNKILIFILFGAFLLKAGVSAFLYELATTIAGAGRGGVAKVTIMSSALFGMISGSAVSNASTMGVITIPMMKKNGYPSEFSAAIECCSSVGGIFMPPIMGSVAFMMADVVGMPYIKVASAALLPAVLYFAAVFVTVDIRADKIGIRGVPREKIHSIYKVISGGLVYLIPILFLLFRLFMGGSPSRVGLEAIGVTILSSWMNKHSRMGFRKIASALSAGVNQGMMIITTMATCGIMIGVINLTGVASKLSSYLMMLSSGSLIATLMVVMFLAMFLGLAMNITPAYLMTAVVAAPILISQGVAPVAAHMFILFYAAMATMTPPVALTAFAAATIAEAQPMRVGFLAMRIVFAAYILPFVFVFSPAILMESGVLQTLLALFSGLVAVLLIACAFEGWLFGKPLRLISRGIIFIAGILALTGNLILILVACLISLMVHIYEKTKGGEVVNEIE